RRESSLHVPIFEEEIGDLASRDGAAIAEAAGTIAARLASNFVERGYWGRAWDDHPAVQVGYALSGAHILRLAWAALEEPAAEANAVHLVAGSDTMTALPAARLGAVAKSELEQEQAAAIARLVSRGLAKYLVARELERKAEKQGGELDGFVTARLANLAANETERADTRSWTLLPQRMDVVRLQLPAGTHELGLRITGAEGRPPRVVELGEVEVG